MTILVRRPCTIIDAYGRRSKRLRNLQMLRDKQMTDIRKKCGSGSISFDVVPSKECIVLWSELEDTLTRIRRSSDTDGMDDAENV
jgi:hypothetical protein